MQRFNRNGITRRARRAIGTAVGVIVVVGLAACGSSSSSSSDSSSSSSSSSTTGRATPQVFTQKGGDIAVTKGSTFVIAPESNPSTGFVWTVSEQPDATIVKLTGQVYEKPDSSALGAPGTERFTFEAVGAGTTTIGLTYARPSDPSSPDNSHDTYTVTVS